MSEGEAVAIGEVMQLYHHQEAAGKVSPVGDACGGSRGKSYPSS
ncbi:hypothetical protein [Nostoc sp. CHAB 5715]|nr:hypothetical protein [Nostoc sp. CHAB 5715]